MAKEEIASPKPDKPTQGNNVKTEFTHNLEITQIGTVSVNNKYPNFIGANSEEGVTVIKPLSAKLFEEIHLMFVTKLNHHTFSTDNYHSGMKKIIDPFGEYGLNLSNQYEIKRKGNTFYIQKINGKGKIFLFSIHVSVEDKKLQYRFVWKKKLKKFVNGYRVKMRMYASQQLGINPVKLYKSAS